jgi:hypothetical protein
MVIGSFFLANIEPVIINGNGSTMWAIILLCTEQFSSKPPKTSKTIAMWHFHLFLLSVASSQAFFKKQKRYLQALCRLTEMIGPFLFVYKCERNEKKLPIGDERSGAQT